MRRSGENKTGNATKEAGGKPVENKGRERRRQAGSGGVQQRLALPAGLSDNAEYEFRYAIDYGARLQILYEQDWDYVNSSGEKLDRKDESVHKVHTGSNPDGSPQFQYLLRKPREFYLSDRKEIQAKIDENMNQIKLDAEAPTGTRYKTDANIRMG